MAGGCDHGTGPEDFGATQNGPNVMGVRHPIQHHHTGRQIACTKADVLKLAPIQRLHLKSCPLVHRLGIKRRVEFAGVTNLGRDSRRIYRILQFHQRILRHHKAQFLTGRIFQRIAHRVQAEQPDGFFRCSAFGLLFFHDPLGLFHGLRPLSSSVRLRA
jgi:hypothetical protein